MANKNRSVKRIAGIAWLVLSAFLVTMATLAAGSDINTQLAQGVTVGAPMEGS